MMQQKKFVPESETISARVHSVGTVSDLGSCIELARGGKTQLDAEVAALASVISQLQVPKGSRIAAWRIAVRHGLAFTFCAPREHVTIVWLNDRWSPRQAAKALHDARVEAVLLTDAVDSRALQHAFRSFSNCPRFVVLGTGFSLGSRLCTLTGQVRLSECSVADEENCALHASSVPSRLSVRGLSSALAGGSDERRVEKGHAIPYAIFYTSGSTGEPKGVVLSHEAMLCQARAKLEFVGYNENSRYLHLAPLFHLGGASSAIAIALAGGTHLVLDGEGRNASTWMNVIERCKVNTLVVVPTTLQMLADAFNSSGDSVGQGGSVDTVLYGGGSCTRALREDTLRRVFPNCSKFVGAYGMTEAASSITFLNHSELPPESQHHASVGRPPSHIDVRIREFEGSFTNHVGLFVGEVTIRGQNIFSGYFGKPWETTRAFTEDGFFKTGDIGAVDASGFLFFMGRRKDMIKTGGENVYAGEVEAVLGCHPSVISSAVVGVPHRVLGEALCAAVIASDQVGIQSSLSAWCRERLSPFKCPKWIVSMDDFPTSSTGKIAKGDIRAELQRRLIPWAKL